MTITELVQFDLKSGHAVNDNGSHENELVKYISRTVTEQPGSQAAFHGVHVENADKLDMAFDWDDISDHERFIATGDKLYTPFVKKALELGSLNLVHVNFQTSFAEVAAQAPVVELGIMYLASDVDTPAVEQAWTRLFEEAKKHAQGYHGSTHGWIVEEVEHEKLEGKGKGYCFALGWDSVDAHMKYRETESFKETIPAVRQLAKAMSVHHTSFRTATGQR